MYSEPGPPSSQSPSDNQGHDGASKQTEGATGGARSDGGGLGGGGGGGGLGGGGVEGGEGDRGCRGPQSAQSVPYWQSGCSAPGPPSSQTPSEAYVGIPMQLLRQTYPGRSGGVGGSGGGGLGGGDDGGSGGLGDEGGEGGEGGEAEGGGAVPRRNVCVWEDPVVKAVP